VIRRFEHCRTQDEGGAQPPRRGSRRCQSPSSSVIPRVSPRCLYRPRERGGNSAPKLREKERKQEAARGEDLRQRTPVLARLRRSRAAVRRAGKPRVSVVILTSRRRVERHVGGSAARSSAAILSHDRQPPRRRSRGC